MGAIGACSVELRLFFFFNDTATTEIYTLSLHDALPISEEGGDLEHIDDLCGDPRLRRFVDIGKDGDVTIEIGRAHV